jgi:hypothetical protein
MRGPTYTEDQLHTLRDSPLVKKPDGLPSILQWMDVPSDQNNTHTNNNGTARRARVVREGEGGATAEQRPLINPMGQFGRRQSMRKSEAQGMVAAINALFVEPGDETVLGPPKLSFLSARKNATEAKERTGITSTDGDNPGDRFAREKTERWSRDRDPDRARGKDYTNGRRGAREDGEGWTNVKGRKSLGQEDFERFQRPSDRNRDKVEGDPENEAAQRRGARERAEPRWGRREDGKEEGPKAGAQGGWREREREPNRDREWNRGGVKVEDDPEWMDTKVEKKDSKPRTQEDFQRWKEQMRAKDTPAEEKDESRVIPDDISTAMYSTVPPMLTQPVHTPSIEPTQGILFGNWGREKATDISATEAISSKPKPDKKSKFMNMFAKKDESAALSQPAAPIPTPPAPVFEGNADKEGFQRILQMLGQVPAADQPATQPSAPASMNGLRHGGGISLDLQQSPPPPPQNNKPAPRTMEQQSILQNILAQRPAAPESRPSQQGRFSSMSPDDSLSEQFRLARLEPSYSEDHFSHQQQPSRNAVPEVNLTALLNGRAQNDSHRDQETKQRQTDFLLTLMQQPSRATPPQQQSQNMPRQNQENQHALFFEQHRQQPQMQAKGRPGLPPGFMEDPRMFAENDMMRREAERREQQREQQELRQQLNMQQQQEAIRIKNARIPMGFAGQQEDLMMGLQRRPTANDSRPMTNMGIPSQPIPDMSFMGGRGQPGMPPTPQDRTNNIPPPPGFGGPPMRQPPPGLNGPNSQQQQQMGPNFSAGNTPVGLPPGFAPPGGNMRGGMGFPGGNGMQGLPPQGYFPPAMGYGGPPMGGMREQDPRLMFDGNGNGGFGGAGLGSRQGQQQQPGRNGGGGMYQ